MWSDGPASSKSNSQTVPSSNNFHCFQGQLGVQKVSFTRRCDMASVNSRLSETSQVGLNLNTNEFACAKIFGHRCCQSRCVSTARAQLSLQELRCRSHSLHFHALCTREKSVVCTALSAVPDHLRTVKNGCSKFTGSDNLFVTLSVLCNSLLNPGRNETLFVGAGCLNVSQNGAAPRSICIAAIDSDLILTDVATLMSDCTSH